MPPPRRCRRGVSLLGLAVLLLAGCGGSGAEVAPTLTGPASPLPIGTLGVPYALTFTASGDIAAYQQQLQDIFKDLGGKRPVVLIE